MSEYFKDQTIMLKRRDKIIQEVGWCTHPTQKWEPESKFEIYKHCAVFEWSFR